jgi:Caffeine-induced death protein 2
VRDVSLAGTGQMRLEREIIPKFRRATAGLGHHAIEDADVPSSAAYRAFTFAVFVFQYGPAAGCVFNRACSELMLDFLRKSRRYSDDSIETHLNALLPSRKLFSTPSPTVLEPPHCADFIRTQLFPTWAARDDLLIYCSTLAEKPVEQSSLAQTPAVQVSERLDPYARRKKEVWEKHDELKRVIRQENGVESVIRLRTWEVVMRRCQLQEVIGDQTWDDQFKMWKEKMR